MDVKLAFVLDATASMGPWIRAAKTKIVDMMKEIAQEHEGIRIKVGLVAYRDYGDPYRFENIDFTSVEEIEDVLDSIYAEGGDDEAEDVAGALRAVTSLRWGEADVGMVIHIADAPAHGFAFHDAHVSDRYPGGDPSGLDPRIFLTAMAEDNIEYTFVKITSSTEKMVDVFRRAYRNSSKFRVIDLRREQYDESLGDPSSLLSSAIVDVVSMSITQNTSSQET